MFLIRISFLSSTYFYNFEVFKFHILKPKNVKKVFEDVDTDQHPDPNPLVRGIQEFGSVPKCHVSGTQYARIV